MMTESEQLDEALTDLIDVKELLADAPYAPAADEITREEAYDWIRQVYAPWYEARDRYLNAINPRQEAEAWRVRSKQ